MADGTINIDVLINKTKFLPDYQDIKKMLTNLGNGSGDRMDQSFERNTNKMVQDAKSAHENVKSIANEAVNQHIRADVSDLKSKESLVARFRSLFKRPVVADIKANDNDTKTKFKAVERAKNEVKKPVMVKVNADTSGFRSGVSSVLGRMREVREQSSKTKHILSGAFGGALLANAATSAWSAITSHIQQATEAVVAYNDKQQVMNATWHTLTGSVKDGKGMVDMVNDLSTSLGQDVDVTDELAQQFYHVYDNKPKTEQLTKSFLIMGDAIGMSGDRLKQVGLDFTHTMSSGLLQLGDFNQISDAFPMYGNALLDYEKKLQHNSALTMGELRKQMSAGKISAQDAAAVLNSLGAKYKDSAENIMGTLPGMARKLKSQLPKIMDDIAKPILDARNPIITQVSNWSSDPKTDQTFKALGNKVGNSMNDVMTQFGKEFSGGGSLSDNLNKWIENIGDKLSGSLEWIANHANAITSIFGSVGSIGKNLTVGYIQTLGGLFKILVGAKGDGVNAIADGLERLSKHQTAIKVIGETMATFWLASKATGFLMKVQDSIKSLKDLKEAIFDVKKAEEETDAADALGNASKGTEGAVEDAGSEVVASGKFAKVGSSSKLLSIGKGIGGKLAIGAMLGFDMFDIFKGLTSKSKSTRFSETGKGIGGLIGAGIGFAIGGPWGAAIGNLIGEQAGKWSGIGAKKFSDGWDAWNNNHHPKGFIEKIGFDTHTALNNWNNIIAKIEKSHPVIGFGIRFAKGTIESEFDAIKDLFKVYFGIKSSVWDVLHDAIIGRFDKIFPDLKKRWTDLFKGFKDDVQNVKDTFSINQQETKRGDSSKKNTHVSKQVTDNIANPISGNNDGGFDPNINLGEAPRKISTPKKSAPKTSTPKKNQGSSTQKTIEKVATERQVSSKDVKNVKDMAKAIGTYEKAVKGLKGAIKKFPTLKIGNTAKQVKKQVSSINSYDKTVNKSKKTIKSYSKSFSGFEKTLKSISKQFKSIESFNKSLGKKDSFSKLNSDFKKLHNTLSKNNIVNDFKKLNSGLKKNNPSKVIDRITKSIKRDTPEWKEFAKQVKVVNSAFKTLNSFSNKMGKNDPFKQLSNDLETLSRTLKRTDVGRLLQKEVNEANAATKNARFASQFKSSVDQIEDTVKGFKSVFNSSWRDVWRHAASDERNEIKHVSTYFNTEMNQVLSGEDKFTGKFMDKWTGWLNNMVNTFINAFGKLPGLASKDMGQVIAQINKGIGSVNTVITAFGGKSLGLAHYATGTSGTGGGLAVVGEQGYELAFDKKHGIYPVGTGGEEVRALEADTAILPHHMSTSFMSMVNSLPHHASGKGDPSQVSDDMMMYIIDHIDTLKKDPVPLLKQEFFKTAKFGGNEFNVNFGNALSNGFLKAIAGPFKKQLEDMDFSMGGNYDPKMILAAAAMMKVHPSASFIKMLQATIQSESGGRNIVQQIHDKNSGGNEARGILQYTPPTFGYFAVPGHKNIMNPFDQLLAFFNNSDWQNSIGPTSIWGHAKVDWLHSGPQGHRRFGNGGWADEESIFGEVPGEPEVAINPNRDNADELIMQAIQKRIEKNPNGTMAKAMNTLHNVKSQAHEFVGKSIANVKNTVANGRASVAGINGDITNNIYFDSQQVAKTTYPIYKAMQSKEINIQTKKGGLH